MCKGLNNSCDISSGNGSNLCLIMVMAVIIGVSVFCTPGCSGDSADAASQSDNTGKMIYVPLTRQSTEYTCESACIQSVMGYYGEDVPEDVINDALQTDPENGVDLELIKQFARSHGYSITMTADMTIEQLKSYIDQGKPVIVIIQAWSSNPENYENDWADGHYVIAVGYDDGKVYFMDPYKLGNYMYITTENFLKRWHDLDGYNENTQLVHYGIVMTKGAPDYNPDEILPLE